MSVRLRSPIGRGPSQLACVRCYSRRIKCTIGEQSASCTNCIQANVTCEPRQRTRRLLDKDAQKIEERLKWLEQELTRHHGIPIEDIQTGSSLSAALRSTSKAPQTLSTLLAGDLVISDPSFDSYSASGSSIESHRNKQRDVRSVNSCFAAYTTSFGYSFLPSPASSGASAHQNEAKVKCLTDSDRHFLVRMFLKWVHSVYPLFHPQYFHEQLNSLCTQLQTEDLTSDQKVNLALYYLLLANGAVHVKQAATSQDPEERALHSNYEKAATTNGISAGILYEYGLELLGSTTSLECPSIPAIQVILLILIYASLQPSGNRQWQLSGIAMRMCTELNLHRILVKISSTEQEKETRSRVFWVAYMLEMTVAFNQGRPPGISYRLIDAPFPAETPSTIMPIYLMRHRVLQNQVVESLYFRNIPATQSMEEVSTIINNVQSQLDLLHTVLPEVYSRSDTPYHQVFWDRIYYVTSGSCHSPTPLNPNPSIEDMEVCIHCASHYIEGYHYLYRHTDTPVSWTALHGTLISMFAIFVIAHSETDMLFARSNPEHLIEKIADLIRKASVIMTIVNQRLANGAINPTEAHFEEMSKLTLKILSIRHRNSLLSWSSTPTPDIGFQTAGTLREASASLSILLQNRSHDRDWDVIEELPLSHWLPAVEDYADAFQELDPNLVSEFDAATFDFNDMSTLQSWTNHR